ncbi:hypothetical protein A1O3_00071 [Capronia epimyces CBS 606.96]|uniref:Zn(2)-C6 fungal-type domain-containing protein n=1 Tax=Capronia epimyces CBS 606.96 TaxID=1182542 RepID=W9YG61_9EURO|nr:uncharacterized protein A1O3_00071 [Capronia epimyces CBS 606.96]EXJ91523.1 hypothetical protein A1O3_00071 [Capronia epimyces CBS 606.96]
MAAGAVLAPDLRLEERHEIQNLIHPCPTIRQLSNLPLTSMAQSPKADEYRGNAFAHKPRLPSFSNFLSGTVPPDLNLAQPSPGPSRWGGLPVNHEAVTHQATQSTPYPPCDRLPPASLSGPNSRTYDHHLDPTQARVWPYTNSDTSDRIAPSLGFFPPGQRLDQSRSRAIVGEEVVPGRGICYIYDDGTVCQKNADGDGANPRWGTTKAGKPRKRLGQACNTCREKKIKCDPGVPKCAQCKKFGRECKFDPGPRTGQKRSGSLPSAYSTSYSSPIEQMSERAPPLRRESTASTDLLGLESPLSRPGNRSSLPLESLLSPVSNDDNVNDNGLEGRPPSKRVRMSASPPPVSDGGLSDCLSVELLSNTTSWPASTPAFSWRADPYKVHRGLTLYYVGKYFARFDNTAYCIFPRKQFTSWVVNCTSKSLEDKMVLYAILAIGTAFVRRPGRDAHRTSFMSIVHDAVMKSGDKLSLQLIQTRLILASLAFSQGEYRQAWDFSSVALRTAYELGYNTEEGVRVVGHPGHQDFDLDYPLLVECRRRTFWSTYVLDCLSDCTSTCVQSTYRPECHLRLPCNKGAYESGNIPPTAFDLTISPSGNEGSSELSEQISHVGLLGYAAQIATIFQKVVSRISGPQFQERNNYRTTLETFRHETMTKMHLWYKYLRTHLRKTHGLKSNSTEPIDGLHILYHYTALLLHRHVRHAHLGQQQINIHVQGAYDHARLMLEIVQKLSNNEGRDAALFHFTTTSPFSGYAITSALDTITAAGILSDVMDHKSRTMSLISSGLEALDSLMQLWHSAQLQRDMIKQRLKTILNASKAASDYNGAFYFTTPMQSPFGLDQDIIYGLPRMRYFQALGWHDRIHHRGPFHELDRE